MKAPLQLALTVIVVAMLAACASTNTRLQTVYVDNQYLATHTALDGVLIIGFTDDPDDRRLLETTLSEALAENGITAVSSLDIMAPTVEISKTNVFAALQDRSMDAVFVSRLARVEEKQFRPGGEKVEREDEICARLWEQYKCRKSTGRVDPNVQSRLSVLLENNLYDMDTEKLVWSFQSEILDPRSIEDVVQSLTRSLIAKLRDRSLI